MKNLLLLRAREVLIPGEPTVCRPSDPCATVYFTENLLCALVVIHVLLHIPILEMTVTFVCQLVACCDLSMSPFSSVSYCFICFEVLLLGTHTLKFLGLPDVLT